MQLKMTAVYLGYG